MKPSYVLAAALCLCSIPAWVALSQKVTAGSTSSTSPTIVSAEQIHAALEPSLDIYKTPLGPAYISAEGNLVVNEVIVLKRGRLGNLYKDVLRLSIDDFDGSKVNGKFITTKLLLSESGLAFHVSHYIIDLTGSEVRVSNRFADDESGTDAAGYDFVRADWKKPKPLIYFKQHWEVEGDVTSIYEYDPTTAKVIRKKGK